MLRIIEISSDEEMEVADEVLEGLLECEDRLDLGGFWNVSYILFSNLLHYSILLM